MDIKWAGLSGSLDRDDRCRCRLLKPQKMSALSRNDDKPRCCAEPSFTRTPPGQGQVQKCKRRSCAPKRSAVRRTQRHRRTPGERISTRFGRCGPSGRPKSRQTSKMGGRVRRPPIWLKSRSYRRSASDGYACRWRRRLRCKGPARRVERRARQHRLRAH